MHRTVGWVDHHELFGPGEGRGVGGILKLAPVQVGAAAIQGKHQDGGEDENSDGDNDDRLA